MQFFFALVTPDQTAFDQAFARCDWTVLSFDEQQKEGDFATLSLEIVNPGAGLLSGRIWLWFSYQPAGSSVAIPRGFFRIVGIPSRIDADTATITVELVARPSDFDARKAAAAAAMQVLPFYSETLIDPQSRSNLDNVLEAYPARWHIDPITHAVTASDVLIGEDGEVELAQSEMFRDGFEQSLDSEVPLRSVTVDAVFTWTQVAQGTVDFASVLLPYVAQSYTFTADNWPASGTSFGSGWTVVAAGAQGAGANAQVLHTDLADETVYTWDDGSQVKLDSSRSDDYLARGITGIKLPPIYTQRDVRFTYDDDGSLASFSDSASWTDGLVPLNTISAATLLVQYAAKRQCSEHVTFTLTADVQPVVTLPGEDEALALPSLRSVNLSDPIGAEIPIGDSRLRSYICQDRGNLDLQYLILLGRANLLRRSRAVEITVAPVLSRLDDISLRRNLRVNDPRLNDDVASGKIIARRFSVVGDTGAVTFTVTIGCAVGNGGSIVGVGGEPVYIDDDYIDYDYQEHTGATIAFSSDVGYGPPAFAPNDDGLDFSGGFSADEALSEPPTVENPFGMQAAAIDAALGSFKVTPGTTGAGQTNNPVQAWQNGQQALLAARSQAVTDALKVVETTITLKPKSMSASFSTDYPITVTELKIPTQITL